MKIADYQTSVATWCRRCFGWEVATDFSERNFRFGEEALELLQACGATKEDVLKLVDYVYARPIGEISQEIGGVSVTLAALIHARGLSWQEAAIKELERIHQDDVMEKIRIKQATKPQRSPLPGTGNLTGLDHDQLRRFNEPSKQGGEEWKEYTGPKRRHSESLVPKPIPVLRSEFDLTPAPAHSAWTKDNMKLEAGGKSDG